jgi:PAS domain S-box-containing protein
MIGDVPWGTHFGLFYRTKQDLIDVLVPYFMAGLKNNEFCMWVTAEPLNAEEAKACMAKVLPDFDVYLDKGQIEIIPYTEWYYINDRFDQERVLSGWVEKLLKARERGFSGLRATGNTFWLEPGVWKDFIDYEQTINDVIGKYDMLGVCSYSLDKCDANDILDVVSTHKFTLTKSNGEWKIIEDQGQKKARKALQESEGRFRAIYDRAAMGIGIANCDGRILDCNNAFQAMLGYSIDELRQKHFADITYPDDIGKNVDLFKQAVAGQINKYQMEQRYVRKDGSLIWCLLTSSVITDTNGDFMYSLAMIDDITERKRAEEELKAAKAQAELYLDLMGHDISNMHQIALGYLELAKDMPAGEKRAMSLDKPVEVLQRSAKLIQNVRKLQKLHDGVFQDQDVDVCKVLSDVRQEFGVVPNKKITLSLNRSEGCYVRANELLHDVFSNLVSNAIKHTGDRADIIVDLDVVRDDSGLYWRVVVEDDGPGIPDDFKAKIFNRALEGTAKAKGMGLGLYLVKSLMDSYGGRVWVEDRVPGDYTKGARFVVMLPAIEK